jgi:hypothetical protein
MARKRCAKDDVRWLWRCFDIRREPFVAFTAKDFAGVCEGRNEPLLPGATSGMRRWTAPADRFTIMG